MGNNFVAIPGSTFFLFAGSDIEKSGTMKYSQYIHCRFVDPIESRSRITDHYVPAQGTTDIATGHSANTFRLLVTAIL